MTKAKTGVPNKSLHSRVSYLYQAAALLSSQRQQSEAVTKHKDGEGARESRGHSSDSGKGFQAAARLLVKDLHAVSQKVQLRMSPAMKHSICKNCDTMLVEGDTSTKEVENRSRGGRKPWADILVLKCNVCGSARRFPMAAKRQKRRPYRGAERTTDAQKVKDG
jgi:ribonuclease P protein subunit RPR2